jgi:UBX domain-containing protein 1
MPGGFEGGGGGAAAPSAPSAPREEAASMQTRFEVDQSLPTTSVQIRLADGTRCGASLTSSPMPSLTHAAAFADLFAG